MGHCTKKVVLDVFRASETDDRYTPDGIYALKSLVLTGNNTKIQILKKFEF